MIITSQEQAMEILNDIREDVTVRETAIRYLAKNPTPAVIARLVQALQDDDFSVRWEAADAVAQLGEAAVLEVLKALTSERVGDPRLRECAYHILHNNIASIPVPMTELLKALHGGAAADITSLVEADHVLRELEKQHALKTLAGKPGATTSPPASNPGAEYGSAHLTGRLSRLNGHHVD
jgi:hypothetical protein